MKEQYEYSRTIDSRQFLASPQCLSITEPHVQPRGVIREIAHLKQCLHHIHRISLIPWYNLSSQTCFGITRPQDPDRWIYHGRG